MQQNNLNVFSKVMIGLLLGGAGATAIVDQFLDEKEGNLLTAYQDGGGIWTICRGVTRIDGKPVKLPNPKYIPKPYEQMQYPGQRVQIDVKFVPQACIVGQEDGTKWYQYTFIDEYSRFRYLEAFEENSTYSSTQFLKHVVEKFPFAIECIQTDNGFEFTNEMGNS